MLTRSSMDGLQWLRYGYALLAFWLASTCAIATSCTRETPAAGPAGAAMVVGTGKSRYFVSNASGKSLTNADTNTRVELPPGTYALALNGSVQSITIRAGETAIIKAGSAIVAGTGKGRYFVSDASGKSLTNADTNSAVELFPGTYTIALNDTTQSLTVRAGETATVSAGSVMMEGAAGGRYFVSDASGKSLTNADTNTAVELFPGDYVIVLKDKKQSFAVRAGQPTVVRDK
jgi:hypothetical protein